MSIANAETDSSVNAIATPAPSPKYDVAFTAAIALPQPLTIGFQTHRVDILISMFLLSLDISGTQF